MGETLYGGAGTSMYQGEPWVRRFMVVQIQYIYIRLSVSGCTVGETLYGGAGTCMYQGEPWVRRSMVVQVHACIRVNRG